MTTSCTDPEHPYYKQILKLKPQDRIDFFMEKSCSRMKYVSLGESLDFICRGAAMNCVHWGLDSKGLARFIQNWMNVQEPRIEYEHVPIEGTKGGYRVEEKKREYQYLWNKFQDDFDNVLPWINYNSCPRDKSHKGVLKQGNIIRCAHVENHFFKPSFIQNDGEFPDKFSGFLRTSFYEREPSLNDNLVLLEFEDERYSPEMSEKEFQKNERLVALFNSEKPTAMVVDPCYAIISDKGSYLPLEAVLSRVNVNESLNGNGSLFPFSGFTMASYAKAWYNQPGERVFFSPAGKADGYKVIKNFQPISSDD